MPRESFPCRQTIMTCGRREAVRILTGDTGSVFFGTLNLPAGFRFGAVLAVSTAPPFNITTGADDNHDSVATDRPPGVGRNTGHGPNLLQLDLRFGKSFRFPRTR